MQYSSKINMKKVIFTAIVLTMAASMVSATFNPPQTEVKLPFAKFIVHENGEWSEWPEAYTPLKKELGNVPTLAVEMINDGTFNLLFKTEQWDDDAKIEKVLFDPEETAQVRKDNPDNNIRVYKYLDSDKYIWLENTSLIEMTNEAYKWKNTKTAKIYIWNNEENRASLYSAISTKIDNMDNESYFDSDISLPFSKSKEFKNNKWTNWPTKWESQEEEHGFTPIFSVKQINAGTFELQLYKSGSASGLFTYRVYYDSSETKRIRKNSNSKNLVVYRYADSQNYIWTENISLKDLANNPFSWESYSKAAIYFWYNDLGNASMYMNDPY